MGVTRSRKFRLAKSLNSKWPLRYFDLVSVSVSVSFSYKNRISRPDLPVTAIAGWTQKFARQ
jgi:hypothetical protein